MHPDIEKTVDSVLTTGELSERSRELLMKKAEQLGVDLLEFELELEGKISLAKKDFTFLLAQQQAPKSNKEGDVKKCPSCGASVPSFTSKCNECGHEYRNIEANETIKKLFEIIEKIENEERSKPLQVEKGFTLFTGGAQFAQQRREKEIANRISGIISTFPIPNSKENILEFIALALPNSICKIPIGDIINSEAKKILKIAWKAKCEQIIIKARFSLKDDKKALEEIEHYSKQLENNKK